MRSLEIWKEMSTLYGKRKSGILRGILTLDEASKLNRLLSTIGRVNVGNILKVRITSVTETFYLPESMECITSTSDLINFFGPYLLYGKVFPLTSISGQHYHITCGVPFPARSDLTAMRDGHGCIELRHDTFFDLIEDSKNIGERITELYLRILDLVCTTQGLPLSPSVSYEFGIEVDVTFIHEAKCSLRSVTLTLTLGQYSHSVAGINLSQSANVILSAIQRSLPE